MVLFAYIHRSGYSSVNYNGDLLIATRLSTYVIRIILEIMRFRHDTEMRSRTYSPGRAYIKVLTTTCLHTFQARMPAAHLSAYICDCWRRGRTTLVRMIDFGGIGLNFTGAPRRRRNFQVVLEVGCDITAEIRHVGDFRVLIVFFRLRVYSV